MMERNQKIRDLFKENHVYYEWGWTAEGTLEITVEDGDWKHDHIYLDWLMKNNGYEKTEERHYGEPTGGDWYSSVHVFKIKEAA